MEKPGRELLPLLFREAWREWRDAQEFFREVTAFELVDEAIFRLQAAEKRLVFLWEEAKREGVSGEISLR